MQVLSLVKPQQLSPLPLHTFTSSNPNKLTSSSIKIHASTTAGNKARTQVSTTKEEKQTEKILNLEVRKNLSIQFEETPLVEVKELEEFPENWRRSRIAWLCKELSGHKRPTCIRLLNAQKKWMRLDDSTFVALHFLRIRLYDPAFWSVYRKNSGEGCGLFVLVLKVYKWMIQQHWYRFDFALATKLADNMGRDRKYGKCREIFDDIINQGRVPSESTFHILIVAYLSASDEECLKEACEIYNRMIHLGAYRPRLSLHNALFRAIVSKPASSAKQYLTQGEFIFHNLVTCGLEIHDDIYGGLLWLHSHQNTIDKERILFLQKEMHLKGISESRDTLLSILRACSKQGDVEEAEKTWLKLLHCDGGIPSQAYVYKMDVYAKLGDPTKSLEIFREKQERFGSTNIVAHQRIIEIMCKDQQVELAESLMKELLESGLKSCAPSYVDLLNMYFKLNLHEKVESTFLECLDKCHPNRIIFGIYLDSLVKTSNIEKAESIFNQMLGNEAIGVASRSCNVLLSGYLSCGDNLKAEKLFKFMREKNYEVESSLMEKLEYIFDSRKKFFQKYVTLKLTPEQREILLGLLLGGLKIEYAGERKLHFVNFKFKENSGMHYTLKRHIYNKFHEWLQHPYGSTDDSDDVPSNFLTVPHTCFGFYADQFWPNGKQSIPKLIHRWLTPCVLAYWFMYSGYTTSNGDILLKVKGGKGDAEKIFKALKLKSLDFRIKQKGKVFWLGFMGTHSSSFRKLIEPYLLDDVQDFLKADPNDQSSLNFTAAESNLWFRNESNSDNNEELHSGFSNTDDSLLEDEDLHNHRA